MADLSALGNAAAVPVVITLTQMIKRSFGFKRAPEVIALLASLLLCFGWEIYGLTPAQWETISTDTLSIFRWGVDSIIVGFATWLSASKLYDLGYRDRKEKKEKLRRETQALDDKEERQDGPITKDPEVNQKLRDILERR